MHMWQKGVVDSETMNFLITEFSRQGLENTLIINGPLGRSYCLSVNLERCKFQIDEFSVVVVG